MGNQIATAAVYVQKGGVGKTTTAAHLASALAGPVGESDVVLVDLSGTQNDLATQFGVQSEAERVTEDRKISAVFSDLWGQIEDALDDVADELTILTGEGPDLIPADDGLGGADQKLANRPLESRYDDLRAFVEDHLAPSYDIALFDLPGAESDVALSGLAAADHVIAPASPGAFEHEQLTALEDDLQSFADVHGYGTGLSMVVPTMIDTRKRLDQKFLEEIEDVYGEQMGWPVPDSQNISNLQADGRTLFDVDLDDLYNTGQRARDAYVVNARRLLEVFDA